MKPLAIDLFSGLGGWSESLMQLGYHCVGYDIERHEYGDQRYPGELVLADVLTLHGSQFKDAALIVASPPCQTYSWMAMPWSKAKAHAAAIRADETGQKLEELNRLFNACFRIQREACLAAGRHIPMVVENVRGAQPWVGRARFNYGSFYLWGDVPALMPATFRATKAPGHGHGWKHPSDPRHTPGLDFTRMAGAHAADGRTNDGGSWFNIGSPGQKVVGQNPDGRKRRDPDGYKRDHPHPFGWKAPRTSSTNTSARKAASAMIAKIPAPLAMHIGRTYLPPPPGNAAGRDG